MSSPVRISTSFLILLGVLALGLQPVSSGPMPSTVHRIVGAWVVSVAGEPGRPAGIPSLYLFTSDGTVLLTSSTSGAKGGQGTWVSAGDRTVIATLNVIFRNANDDFTGTVKLRQKLTLNATYDEYTGLSKRDDFDAQGRLRRSSDAKLHATRVKVESP